VAAGGTDPESSMSVAVVGDGSARFPTVSLRMVREEEPAVTLISYGGMAPFAMEAAARVFVKEEILVEVLVPSLIMPLPLEDLLPAVRASGRVVVLEEGPRTSGWGAEVASSLYEAAFGESRSPIERIGARSVPIPAASHLERQVLPSVEAIEKSIYRLAGS
jgi:pyruvate/2-oxoglutarate/acetoin dehydrogenase E1 component